MNPKWPKSDFFGLKLILNDFTDNFKKYSLESVETFICKSEIAFWCTFDQNISKTFEHFKVWIESGLKSEFFGLKLILNTFIENFKKCFLESVETLFASQK